MYRGSSRLLPTIWGEKTKSMSLCYELLFRGHNFQKVRHPKTKYQLPSLRCNVWSSLDVFILSRIFPQPQYIARQLYLTSDSYSCPDVGLVPSLHHIQCPLLFSCANITKISASCLPHNTQNYIFFFTTFEKNSVLWEYFYVYLQAHWLK